MQAETHHIKTIDQSESRDGEKPNLVPRSYASNKETYSPEARKEEENSD